MNYSNKNIDFSRQVLLEKMTRPAPGIAIYPKNPTDTRLLLQIIDNATVIAIRYISSTTVNQSVSFVGKSVEEVVQEINALTIPIEARTINNISSLQQGDLISLGANHVDIPGGIPVYDRIDNNGIVIRSKRISVRHKSNNKIKLVPPYSNSPSLPWYPRITNGSFTQKYKGKLYHFYIPEFDQQSWSTKYGKPFKDLFSIQPVQLEDNVYQLPRYPVYWNGQNITVYNGDAVVSDQVIEDIDINNGIIYIRPGSYLADDFTIDYTYLENTYVYKYLNVNGHFSQNPLILDKYIVIYLLPAESHQGLRKRCVFHTIGDSVDQAIDSIQVDDPNSPIAIIGAYNIQQLFSTDNISVLDTRVKGGGLVDVEGPTSPVHNLDKTFETNEVPIEAIYQEAYRFWDIGNYDGEAYPGAAAIAIDLPLYLKDVMSLSDIKKKAVKSAAAGIYPSIRFTERHLPAITGLVGQVSCAYNLDLSDIFVKSGSSYLHNSIPAIYTGVGFFSEKYNIPSSVLSGDWSSFQPSLTIVNSPSVIEVNTETGVVIPFIKSTPWAGVSWEERSVAYSEGIDSSTAVYSNWKKVSYLDDRQSATGELVKSYITFNPHSTAKQYKNIKVHAPYQTGNLYTLVQSGIRSIINTTLSLQDTDTHIKERYAAIDKSVKTPESDYLLNSSLYNHIYNASNTPIEAEYASQLDSIGDVLVSSGVYDSGHYIKVYLQNIDQYVKVENIPYYIFDYTDSVQVLNKYLNYRYRNNTWDEYCTSGASASVNLVNTLLYDTGYFSDFSQGIPIYWTYFPASGELPDAFSGIGIPSSIEYGSYNSEVDEAINYDYLNNYSFPMAMSTVLSATGENLDVKVSNIIKLAYDTAINTTINNIEDHISAQWYLSGFEIPTHWFADNGRLSLYLGQTLSNLIKGYEYLKTYNESRSYISDNTLPLYAGPDYLSYIFSGIEVVLEAGYEPVYHNILRGGITKPDMATTIYAYGWYLNNWKENYGIQSKTYSNDSRLKYKTLFDFGLKQLIKNQITKDGDLLETTTIYGEPGPFPASVASKLLPALAEAVKYDFSEWSPVTEGYLKTLINNYSIDGLYYSDPYKNNSSPGKENDVLKGLLGIHTNLESSGKPDMWEPMHSDLSTLRGSVFLPNFTYSTPPTGNWQNTVNRLAFWKFYNSGDVETSLSHLKNIGINTISVELDYLYWREHPSIFHDKLSHLLSGSYSNRIRVIPTILPGGTSQVTTGNEALYISDFGHTGSTYNLAAVNYTGFMEDTAYSGRGYVESLISNYDNHPAILAWNITTQPKPVADAITNYNSVAYILKDNNTRNPVIYTIGNVMTVPDLYGSPEATDETTPGPLYGSGPVYADDTYNLSSPIYNPNIDFIGIEPNRLFSGSINMYSNIITKPTIVFNYGDAGYADYTLSINRISGPVVLSNLHVKSGTFEGILYEDGLSRNYLQSNSIVNLANSQAIYPTADIQQELDFSDRYIFPTGYNPSDNVFTILSELRSWTTRTQFSSQTSGEFYRQVSMLSKVDEAVRTYDYVSTWPETYYYVPKILSIEDCTNLNYYKTSWNGMDPFSETSEIVMNGSEIDYSYYNTYITVWGQYLNYICGKVGFNG